MENVQMKCSLCNHTMIVTNRGWSQVYHCARCHGMERFRHDREILKSTFRDCHLCGNRFEVQTTGTFKIATCEECKSNG